MNFEVYTPEGSTTYTGNARYDIEHPGAGLLLAWTHDGDKIVYGQGGWYRVEERPAPKSDGASSDG